MNFSRCSISGAMALLLALAAGGCGKPGAKNQWGGDSPASAVMARVEREIVDTEVELVANLAPKNEVDIISELDATVLEMLFTEGQHVEKGQELVRLDPVQTQARLEEAEARFNLAELSYLRNKDLLANDTISQQEYDRAEAEYHDTKAGLALARDDRSKTTLAAPFAGTVGEKEVSVGQYVSRGARLTRLISVDPLEVVFDIPERYLGRLKDDLVVRFSTDAFPEESFEGLVVYVAPQLDEKTRTIRVKAEVRNEDGRLKPGMFGELSLVLERREDALVIPGACIQLLGGAATVVVLDGEGKTAFRAVQVGRRFKGRAEITDGLAEGEYVVVEGFQKMGPGMSVIASPESAEYGVTPGPLTPATTTSPSPEAPADKQAAEETDADL